MSVRNPQPDLGVQVVVSQRVHWLSVQQDQPLLRLVEVFQQTHAGALPATRWSHERGDLAGPQSERDSLQTQDSRYIHPQKVNVKK